MEQQGRGCNTQSQRQSAAQNLALPKEAALTPPLPLPEQSHPFWLSLGIRFRNGGNDRKVNGQELQL